MAILNLHSWLQTSRANGPSNRFVLWFQGCSLGCAGCFNEAMHSKAPRLLASHESVVATIQSLSCRIEGVTISGGEPLEQPHGLLDLLRDLRRKTTLSVVLYSGYTYEEIGRSDLGPAILDHCDLLISGPFCSELATFNGLVGSSNQEIHFLTSRYSPSDLVDWCESELIIDATGQVTLSGVHVPSLTNQGCLENIDTLPGRYSRLMNIGGNCDFFS